MLLTSVIRTFAGTYFFIFVPSARLRRPFSLILTKDDVRVSKHPAPTLVLSLFLSLTHSLLPSLVLHSPAPYSHPSPLYFEINLSATLAIFTLLINLSFPTAAPFIICHVLPHIPFDRFMCDYRSVLKMCFSFFFLLDPSRIKFDFASVDHIINNWVWFNLSVCRSRCSSSNLLINQKQQKVSLLRWKLTSWKQYRKTKQLHQIQRFASMLNCRGAFL